MPTVVVGAVVAAAGSAAAGLIAGTAITLASVGTAFVGSILVGTANMLMAKNGKRSSSLSANRSITQTIKGSNEPRTVVYGLTRVSGVIVYAASTNTNQYLHLVIALAGHKIQAIDEILLGDVSVPFDQISATTSMVSGGTLKDLARIKKYTGSDTQEADAQLVSEVAEWTSAHRLRGIAYVYVRLKYDPNKFPSGIPNVTAIVRGAQVYDPRDGMVRWTMNPALIARDYLSNGDYGFESGDFIDDAAVAAAANICDEIVSTNAENFNITAINTTQNTLQLKTTQLKLTTGDRVQVSSTGTLPGGLSAATDYFVVPYQFCGTPRVRLAMTFDDALQRNTIDLTSSGSGTMTLTKTGEPRYQCSLVLDRAATLGDNLTAILTSFGGKAVYAGGMWRILAANYITPTVTLSESDLISEISVTTKIKRSERFNAVKGLYYAPINNWQSSSYPPVVDEAAFERDSIQIDRDYDLPGTDRPLTAKRLAKIELKKAVQEITTSVTCTLKALQLQCGETVALSIARLGWSAKPFEIVGFTLTYQADQVGVNLTLRETAANIYDWDTSEESIVDAAPNTSLPSAFTVDAVTGLAFDSTAIPTDGGDTFYLIKIDWDTHPDTFVLQGGQFEIQYKLSTETDYKPSFFVDGGLTTSDIIQAKIGATYDIRIRAINNLGVHANWATLTGAVAGSSGGVTASLDWGAVTDTVGTTNDWGLVTDTVGTTNDWGGVI